MTISAKANIESSARSPGDDDAYIELFDTLLIETRASSALQKARVSAARRRPKLSGDSIEEAIPDPISNSEVKLFGADGTAWGICVGE